MVTKIKKGLIFVSASLGLQEVYSCGLSGSIESILSKYYIDDQKVSKETASEANCKILKDFSSKLMKAIDAFKADSKNIDGTNCVAAIKEIQKFFTDINDKDGKEFIGVFIKILRKVI